MQQHSSRTMDKIRLICMQQMMNKADGASNKLDKQIARCNCSRQNRKSMLLFEILQYVCDLSRR